MDLHKIDPNSPTWQLVKSKAEKRVQEGLDRIVRQSTDPIKTEFERGVIAAMRSILDLPNAR